MSSETQKELNVDKKQQTRIIPLVRRQGKEAVPARYKNRPALIRAWLHRAWVIAEEHGLLTRHDEE